MRATSNHSAASTSTPLSDAELVEQLKQQLATTEQRLQYAELGIQVDGESSHERTVLCQIPY